MDTQASYRKERIESFELRAYRRFMKISWVREITNEKTFTTFKIETATTPHDQKAEEQAYLRHIVRGDNKYEVSRN